MSFNHFCEELPVEAVRWFYFSRSSAARAWKPFCGYDSIRLETAYREICDGALDSKDCNVPVRGEMFEVNMGTLSCVPIYWFSKRKFTTKKRSWCSTRVLRGMWYFRLNSVPLEPEMNKRIEQEHITSALPKMQKLTKRKGHKAVHKLTDKYFDVKWMPDGVVYLVTRSVQPFGSIKFPGGLSSVSISRGYHKLSDINDRLAPITHICFVVHGIGQQLASIRHECSRFRKISRTVQKKLYPKLDEADQRLEFIPVDWRSSLHLNSDTLDNITVSQMRPLRAFINHCFVDILFYTSPVYREVLMNSLSYELTRLFNVFCSKNPQFLQRGGQISVLAHSLGSVMMYDILKTSATNSKCTFDISTGSNDRNFTIRQSSSRNNGRKSLDKMFSLNNTVKSLKCGSFVENIDRPEEWKPLPQLANLFMIGSPLALFLAVNDLPHMSNSLSPITNKTVLANDQNELGPTTVLRKLADKVSYAKGMDLDEDSVDALISYFSCRKVFNIFHSYDPVAYRIEPLLLKHYASIAPVVLPKASVSALEKSLSLQECFNEQVHKCLQYPVEYEGIETSSRASTSRSHSAHQGTSSVIEMSDSDSQNFNVDESSESSHEKLLLNRLSVMDANFTYKQHKSLAMKVFGNYITRRSSNVTYLGPSVRELRSLPNSNEKQLRQRVDYEWQKSFSSLAIMSAHSSYWTSDELAFFILYQVFGPPSGMR